MMKIPLFVLELILLQSTTMFGLGDGLSFIDRASITTNSNLGSGSSSGGGGSRCCSRRSTLKRIFANGMLIATTTTTTTATTSDRANAATDEGISAITESSIGNAFRRSAIRGARAIDKIDEKWASFSDSLRDEKKCDEATGRRLYDNGFRKDGTRVGNPVLGALCDPPILAPFDEKFASRIVDLAVSSALVAGAAGGDEATLLRSISNIEELVKPSFDRDINNNSKDEQDRKRKYYNFKLYSTLRAIGSALNGTTTSGAIIKFQLVWGRALVAMLAPNAGRSDYASPFPEMKDEFEDYDYDKNSLLDGLGTLKVSLDEMKIAGMLSYFEISIPYDDYGSVVTVAVDDDVAIGSEMLLLAENDTNVGGPFHAIIRAVMTDRAKINYGLDAFFIDPSTTKQSVYDPTQLLLSMNNLCKM